MKQKNSQRNIHYFVIFVLFILFFTKLTEGVTITPVKFSWEIDSKNRPKSLIKTGQKTRIQSVPIYVTFLIIGSQAELDELENVGSLEIFVEFYVNGMVVARPQVGITPKLWVRDRNGLHREVNERGYFDWATVALISKPLGKTIEVVIRDKCGNVLTPIVNNGPIYKPRIILEK